MNENEPVPLPTKDPVGDTAKAKAEKARQARPKWSKRLSPAFQGWLTSAQKGLSHGFANHLRGYALCVLLPMVLMAVYLLALASPRYESEAQLIVKQADRLPGTDAGLSLLGAATPEQKDALLVKAYIHSLDMAQHLERSIGLRDLYNRSGTDVLSRLGDATQEEFLAYYRKHTALYFDEKASILSVKAQAFTPQDATLIANTLIAESERFINQIGHKLAQEQVAFVQQESQRAQEQLRQAKSALLRFQESNSLFNPEAQSAAQLAVVNELEAEISRQQAELKVKQSFLNENSPEVVTLKQRINALQTQLEQERLRLVSENGKNSLNEINAEYQNILLNVEFATDLYRTTLSSLEQARVEAYRKLKHLMVVARPQPGEEANYPETAYILATWFVVLSMIYGLLSIVIATIREHRDM